MTGAEILQENFNWHMNNLHWYILFAFVIVVGGYINAYRKNRKKKGIIELKDFSPFNMTNYNYICLLFYTISRRKFK